MSDVLKFNPCYVCKEEAQVENLQSSYLVDCPRCGAYEIEAVATTIELVDRDPILTYLELARRTGQVRPMIFRELLKR